MAAHCSWHFFSLRVPNCFPCFFVFFPFLHFILKYINHLTMGKLRLVIALFVKDYIVFRCGYYGKYLTQRRIRLFYWIPFPVFAQLSLKRYVMHNSRTVKICLSSTVYCNLMCTFIYIDVTILLDCYCCHFILRLLLLLHCCIHTNDVWFYISLG